MGLEPSVQVKFSLNDASESAMKAEKTVAAKICPICQHVFQGNGWDGIDAHWKAKHENEMPYRDAWPLLRDGKYKTR